MSLIIKNLDVKIEQHTILRDVSLTVEDGELLSLLGPSGCGKSTLLKAAAGLIEIAGGSMSAGIKSLDGLPPEKRGIVVVFQDLRLFSNMSVIDNVAFPLKMRGMKKGQRHERAEYYLKKVQLDGMEQRRISQLSGGQQQRVALARALAADPDVLLLDEPFSSLDENLREDMRKLLSDIHDEMKNTIVLVTHDQKEALQLSDRIAVMKHGKILQCDSPESIYEQPGCLEIAEYLGLGNFIVGEIKDGIFVGIDGAESITFFTGKPDGLYKILIRKEQVRLSPTGIKAEVERISYLGSVYQVCARVGKQLLTFDLAPHQIQQITDERENVCLQIDYEVLESFFMM